LFKNLNSALHDDDVELRMFSEILTCIKKSKYDKNKGAKTDPKNFRPITILSCFGKLFRSVMNNRLKTFSDEFLLLNENPTGFRKK
jgi:hypothetical protein